MKPHPPMNRPARSGGYVVVTSLVMMVVLMLLASIILTGSVAGVQQAGGHSGLIRARAAAEAGQARAAFTLSESMVPGIDAVLNPYATQFLQQGQNAANTQIIPNLQFGTVITQLNAMTGTSQSGTVNGANFTTTIRFNNFRFDPGSYNPQGLGQQYYVDYLVTSQGQSGTFSRNVEVNGTLRISMGRAPLNQYLLLADDGGSQEGNYFGTGMNYDGPVQVNRNWRFAGSPIFSMGAKTAASTVSMWNCSGKGAWSNVSTQVSNCTTPNWGGYGLQYSAPSIQLPENSFSQARAALGLPATLLTTPTSNERCAALGISPCANGQPAAGVYLPSPASGNKAGIYIQGNAQVHLSVQNGKQIYTILQGNQATTISVTYPNGPTVITRPNGTTETRSNYIPNGQLYVEGSITSLKGPARTGTLPTPLPANNVVPPQIPPAIASESQLNIAAATDIVVQGDLTYETNPVTTPSANNILGLIAGSGSVRVGTAAPNDLYMHGALLAGAAGQGFKVDDYNKGSPRGSIHLLGSLAESKEPPRGIGEIANDGTVKVVQGYGDAFNFDRRFVSGAKSPPFFPGTSLFSAQTALPSQRDWTEK